MRFLRDQGLSFGCMESMDYDNLLVQFTYISKTCWLFKDSDIKTSVPNGLSIPT